MIQQANKKRSERAFAIGDWVYLKLQPYKQKSVATRKSHKLSPKFYGPYQVIDRIGTVTYKLFPPPTATIHLVFHISLLKKHVGCKKVYEDLTELHDEPAPQPQAILDRRMVKHQNHAAS
jgi:hypothetical protein